MMVTKKHIARRTFLQGIGAAIGLPMLDSMIPAFAAPAVAREVPIRLLFTYIPVGANMPSWTPIGEGGDYQFSRILKPLEAFRADFSVVSGLDHHQAEALTTVLETTLVPALRTSPEFIAKKRAAPIFSAAYPWIRSRQSRLQAKRVFLPSNWDATIPAPWEPAIPAIAALTRTRFLAHADLATPAGNQSACGL
jgi:hypothetical protein